MKPTAFGLTCGERFLLQRRRAGVSQADTAARLGVTLYRYRAIENDTGRPLRTMAVPRIGVPRIGVLGTHEICFLKRHRAGIPLNRLAKTLRMTCNWLCEIEHGRQPVGILARHWRVAAGRRHAAAACKQP